MKIFFQLRQDRHRNRKGKQRVENSSWDNLPNENDLSQLKSQRSLYIYIYIYIYIYSNEPKYLSWLCKKSRPYSLLVIMTAKGMQIQMNMK